MFLYGLSIFPAAKLLWMYPKAFKIKCNNRNSNVLTILLHPLTVSKMHAPISISLSLQETKVTSSPWGPVETPFPLPRGLAAVGKILPPPLSAAALSQTPEEHWSSEPGESDLREIGQTLTDRSQTWSMF